MTQLLCAHGAAASKMFSDLAEACDLTALAPATMQHNLHLAHLCSIPEASVITKASDQHEVTVPGMRHRAVRAGALPYLRGVACVSTAA